jgi:hypothetical protein
MGDIPYFRHERPHIHVENTSALPRVIFTGKSAV